MEWDAELGPGELPRARGRRGASVPARLHLGHDRPAQGRAARARQLPASRSHGRRPTSPTSAPATASSSRPTWAGSWARGRWSAPARSGRASSTWKALRIGPTTGSGGTVEEERVTMLGVSPTLIRALIPKGEPAADLSSLRAITTTGEPWNAGPVRLAERARRRRRAHSDHQHLRRHRGRRVLPLRRRRWRPVEARLARLPGARQGRWTSSTPEGTPSARRGRRARLHAGRGPG